MRDAKSRRDKEDQNQKIQGGTSHQPIARLPRASCAMSSERNRRPQGARPGFIEAVYGRAMVLELRHRMLRIEVEKAIQVHYRGELICNHRLDLVVDSAVVVEIKAVRKIRPIHHAQILSYLKASGCRVGLLMNFNATTLVDGLRRFVL